MFRNFLKSQEGCGDWKCENCNEEHCGLHDVLIEVRDASLIILEEKTLLDLID